MGQGQACTPLGMVLLSLLPCNAMLHAQYTALFDVDAFTLPPWQAKSPLRSYGASCKVDFPTWCHAYRSLHSGRVIAPSNKRLDMHAGLVQSTQCQAVIVWSLWAQESACIMHGTTRVQACPACLCVVPARHAYMCKHVYTLTMPWRCSHYMIQFACACSAGPTNRDRYIA